MFSETTLYIITPRNTYFGAEVFDFLSNCFFSADHQFKDWLAFKEWLVDIGMLQCAYSVTISRHLSVSSTPDPPFHSFI